MVAATSVSSSHPPCPSSPLPTGLLRACLAGDPDAWDRLFQLSFPIIYAIARTDFGLHREDAEDVVQMVHLKLYQHLGELRDMACFTPWLRRMAQRTVVDLLRHKEQALSLEALADSGMELSDHASCSASYAADPPDGTDARLAARLDLQRALAFLPPRYREPVIYYLVQGKPQDEIGRLLGRPRSTIATQIQRGLLKLRRYLEGEYRDDR
jgi:RNA polymerase sigma-70 factor (ECF subfamily)